MTKAGLPLRLAVAISALLAIAALFWLASFWFEAPAPATPPPRNPFGGALPREALPTGSGFGAFILSWQSAFYRDLTAALKAIATSTTALPGLLGLAFAYGVFHAAGPGHGKAVISSYILADGRSLKRGLVLCVLAALLQAFVAIALVLTLTLALKATAATMGVTTRLIEQTSFLLVALVGLWVLWRKSRQAAALLDGTALTHDEACDHVHLPEAQVIGRMQSYRELAAVVLAAGLRPCAGALILLVLALSQGLFWAGIVATFAMAAGTAIMTGALAALAVFFKFAAMRLATGRGVWPARILLGLECLAAAFVALLGLVLFFGYWSSSQGA